MTELEVMAQIASIVDTWREEGRRQVSKRLSEIDRLIIQFQKDEWKKEHNNV